ncbi:MAG: TonB-dependent receptor [Opitutales bacterium]|nr:TonB-dependent receptor [Opitutales bacterium]
MYSYKKSAAALTVALLSISSFAQEASDEIIDLRPYTVSGTVDSQRVEDSLIPISELSGEDLERARAHTLGETLEGIAGVHSTSFGAGASRPVIRGFEGPRVQVLEDALGTFDVSDSSPDHAVTVNPDFAEYIDVIRGPATLLYGNSAIGGIVNVIGNRVPLRRSTTMVEAEIEAHYEDVSDGWDFGGVATVGQGDWALKVNVSWLDHENYEIPGMSDSKYAEEEFHDDEEHEDEHHDEDEHGHEEEEVEGILSNSAVENRAASIGYSWFIGEDSRISVSYYDQHSEYGVPGHAHHHGDEHGHEDDHDHEEEEHEDEEHEDEEHHDEDEHEHEHGEEEDVFIDLDHKKFRLEGVFALEGDVFEQLQVSLQVSDYEHIEQEGDHVGTVYDREGWEARAEAKHRLSDNSVGILGAQLSSSEFSVAGEEAFVPNSDESILALFALEEWTGDSVGYSLGARVERRELDVQGFESDDDLSVSLSAAGRFDINENLGFNTSLSRTERNPTVTELYADGPHVSTRQYEEGNPDLGKESVWSADAGFVWDSEKWTSRFSAFVYLFSDYIFAAPEAESRDGFQVFHYHAVDATFYGFEWETDYNVWQDDESSLDFSLVLDTVETDISDSSENLPRIPPMRVGVGFDYRWNNWSFWGRNQYNFKQDEVADNEFPTDAFNQLDLGIEYEFTSGQIVGRVFVKGKNLLDEEIRRHTSFLKDLAPQPGRNIIVGFGFRY